MYTFIALRKLLKSVYLVLKIVTLLQATTKGGKLSGKGYGLVWVNVLSSNCWRHDVSSLKMTAI